MLHKYQKVDLIYSPSEKQLKFISHSTCPPINTSFKAFFSSEHTLNGINKIAPIVTHIREVPTYRNLINQVLIKDNNPNQNKNFRLTQLSNLELYLIFHKFLTISHPKDLMMSYLRKLIGIESHLIGMQQAIVVDYEIDSAHLIVQYKKLISNLPRFFHTLLGLTDLKNALNSWHRKRLWQSQRNTPKTFKEQFPTVIIKSTKQDSSGDDDGMGGHNMLNPKRTQEQQAKDDSTPLRKNSKRGH